MNSRMEIDFLDLNRKPQLSEMEKQHKKAYGMKWPFSSMADLATQHENTFFQNYNSTSIVSINSKNSPNNYKSTKEQQYFGGGFPLVTKTSTYDSRKNYDHLRQNQSTLTIFYRGEVHIFQNISPDKAELLIDLVSKSTTLHMDEILEKVIKEKSEENKSEPSNISINYAKGALAMARRATLARFLEKRKHRLIKARPYLYGENLSKFPFDIHQEEETASSSVQWES